MKPTLTENEAKLLRAFKLYRTHTVCGLAAKAGIEIPEDCSHDDFGEALTGIVRKHLVDIHVTHGLCPEGPSYISSHSLSELGKVLLQRIDPSHN